MEDLVMCVCDIESVVLCVILGRYQ